jgi:hypothetical protein
VTFNATATKAHQVSKQKESKTLNEVVFRVRESSRGHKFVIGNPFHRSHFEATSFLTIVTCMIAHSY